MNKLHPGARWLFRVNSYLVLIVFSFIIGGFIVPSIIVSLFTKSFSVGLILSAILISLIFVVILGEIYSRLAYNNWFYEFTDDGLRLERGIIWKRYSNVPYERIQNVDVHRGIIARMFGFSSVMIQTAGYSARAQSEGNIPALNMNEAEKIREFIMKKITRRR